jgi:ABC-2 type transport system ATP-binding protein
MLQRVGFAAALVHEPELLILDEPMSGLDPVGRKEIRDLILAERHAGRTVFFSTHILADVELLCDRVTILRKGEVVEAGRLRDLVGTTTLRYELALLDVSEEMKADLKQRHLSLTQQGDTTVLEVEGESLVQDLLREVLPRGARLASMTPKRETLESIFVRKAL